MPTVPPPFHIHPMRFQDLSAVMEIEREVMPTPWSEAGYRHELTTNSLAHYFVLLVQGELSGYGGYWLIAGEAHISIIAVKRSRQHQGLGRGLLDAILMDAGRRGAVQALLEVRRGNMPAQRLYQRSGFEFVGERRGYYQDTGEDALLMTLDMMPLIPPVSP